MGRAAKYKPLDGADVDGSDPAEKGQLQTHPDHPIIISRGFKISNLLHTAILSVEIILCVFLIAGYVVLHNTRQSLKADSLLDGLSQLSSYNTTMRFHNNSELLSDSGEAAEYWKDLLESGGVISLNTEWAHEQGLRPSAMSPTDSSQSIYQVDVFHALHCLNAIRQNLVPDTPPPWNEKHMLHCLDYIRHQLLCHPDLTLITTNDLEEFVLDETHTCKDYGAVLDWVDRHRWVEFPEWLRTKEEP